VDWSHCPDKHFQSAELRRQIDLAVDSLPPKLKAIFFLRHVRELSTAESAGKLGVTVLAAKTRLFRARKVLRESLGNYVAC
jgi:RNA polymerase sigma-70 factor (ECF subfamily)